MDLYVLTLATSHIFNPSPPVEDHGGMVVHMEEGQLTVLLSQDEKYLKNINKHKGRHAGRYNKYAPFDVNKEKTI